ncbi:hypothetical protein AAMO2058_000170600 [Amorphochlora amoebiformis]|uniref:60S ribosomal protein L31 n=1 Tax=Amorphochlora amoebiformis TaxID=1561963 RepID=A0A7S0DHZ2_9EUKA|mmetsp:Transcript_2819/g.4275  ORF Transcript_2819/g.4275 Transcript_2819/m.4275 type:complete len:123 (+) Transcript_2819:55-423(+)
MAKGDRKERKANAMKVIIRECTINLHKRLHKTTFKKKAPKAIKEIKAFAQKMMRTEDVRVDVQLNKFLWSKGVRNVPHRVRVRLHRKRNEDEEASDQFYTHVSYVKVESFKGLETKPIEDEE